jgi:hypothetical protein
MRLEDSNLFTKSHFLSTFVQERTKEYEFQHGLGRGLHGLWELTPTQVEIKAREGQVVNRGRIVYLTHVTDKEKLKVTRC